MLSNAVRCSFLLLALGVGLCLLPAPLQADSSVHRQIGAGPLYPAEPDALLAALDRFYAQANPNPLNGRLFAAIVPHSGYGLSGVVAANVYKPLQQGQFDKVIILGPSHTTRFEGCSIPAVEFYQTPFGVVALHQAVIRELCYSPLFSMRGLSYTPSPRHVRIHEDEYSIEMQLPFLQERLSRFTLIPILVGDLSDPDGRIDPARIEAVAETITKVMDDRTLLLVSTDFTHYGHDFSFKPFGSDALEQIQRLDSRAYNLLVTKNFKQFVAYLETTRNPICGEASLLVLLKLLPPQAIGTIHASGVSMAQTKNPNRSVSYGAITFHIPDNAENEDQQVVRSLKITPEGAEFKEEKRNPDE